LFFRVFFFIMGLTYLRRRNNRWVDSRAAPPSEHSKPVVYFFTLEPHEDFTVVQDPFRHSFRKKLLSTVAPLIAQDRAIPSLCRASTQDRCCTSERVPKIEMESVLGATARKNSVPPQPADAKTFFGRTRGPDHRAISGRFRGTV